MEPHAVQGGGYEPTERKSETVKNVTNRVLEELHVWNEADTYPRRSASAAAHASRELAINRKTGRRSSPVVAAVADGGDAPRDVEQLLAQPPDVHENDDAGERSARLRVDGERVHRTIRCRDVDEPLFHRSRPARWRNGQGALAYYNRRKRRHAGQASTSRKPPGRHARESGHPVITGVAMLQ